MASLSLKKRGYMFYFAHLFLLASVILSGALCSFAAENAGADTGCSAYAGRNPTPFLAGTASAQKFDIAIDGHHGVLLLPEKTAEADSIPWVWFAPVVPGAPSERHSFILQHVFDAGMAFAYVDVGESYGSVEGTQIYSEFHDVLQRCFHLSRKPVLLPQSRGGLMLFNWAAMHPDEVERIAGIYPVCNLRSYPGLAIAAKAYGMSQEQLESEVDKYNPMDLMAALAQAKIPILIIHGDNDKIVPLDQNSAPFVRHYRELGGPAELIVVHGKGHEEVDEFFTSREFVRFLTTGQPSPQ